MNVPFIINADMECLLEWIDIFHNNSKKSSATKITKTLDSGYSLLHIAQLMHQKINLIIIEVKTAWKNCEDLKKHATKIINYGKTEIIPSTYEENKSYKKQKVCYICRK